MLKRLLGLCAWLVLTGIASAAEHPNFVLVFIDDLGYGDFSCYGNERVETTNIDRLASEGIRFTQFYVAAPICSPSRVGITTGQYPARWDITSYLAHRELNEERGMDQWLDPQAPTLPRMLHDTGYATGHFGKWHLGGQRDVGEAPMITEYGFDETLTQFEGLGDRVLAQFETLYQDNDGKRGLELGSEKLGRGNITWMPRYEVTDAFVDRAIGFMKKSAKTGKPFYVNVWPDDVHTPLEPPPALRGDGSKRSNYDGVLKNLDNQLGVLFDAIRNDAELRDNTLVILTSDNGPEAGAGSAGPLRGNKGELYEGGIREPFIVWGPSLIDEKVRGSVNEKSVVGSVDLPPSLLSLAGVEAPADVNFDGVDMSQSLIGEKQEVREKPLIWSRPPDRPGPRGSLPDLAIRDGDWKLLIEADGTRPELYDLATDISESKNVAKQNPEVVKRLKDKLLSWNEEVEAVAVSRRASSLKEVAEGEFFVNPIAEGADPWVVRHEGSYYWCQSHGNRGVAIWKSDTLTDLGERHVVWTAPEMGPHSAEIWAPELHFLDGRWYIYVAASNGQNKNHRMIAVESEDENPLGKYHLKGELYTGDSIATGEENRWAIDGTVLEHEGDRYFLWSGWKDDRDEQFLYIATMKNPWTIDSNRVLMCDNDDYLWERVSESADQRGLSEAPQVLVRDGRTFVVYSCSGSWEPTYKLGLLELRTNGDPMKASDWVKHDQPVFQSTEQTYGVGHCTFTKSPDGKEDWFVYHAKRDRNPGWRRALFAQPFTWTKSGEPEFGTPVAAGEPLAYPSGHEANLVSAEFEEQFDNGLTRWSYYGHQQFFDLKEEELHLGVRPAKAVNDYRSGEKAILRGGHWNDMAVSTDVKVIDGGRDAGVLFRIKNPSVGFDAQEGYFAGIIPRNDLVILGYMDGENWEEIARASHPLENGKTYRLTVQAVGNRLAVSVDDEEVLRANDNRSQSGTVGLRVVDSHAAFDNVEIVPVKRGKSNAKTGFVPTPYRDVVRRQ